MGVCCSKTHTQITSKPNNAVASPTPPQTLKKDGFVVKNPKTHEIDAHPDQETRKSSISDITNSAGSIGVPVRTSSCTKEEVDAILIQCGRLSRSSSGVNPAGGETPTRGRRYSGSKRSFDFDDEVAVAVAVEGDPQPRQQREARASSPSSRRRSRERDPQQQRSGSKERGSGSGSGRRVSRSPNRRSESPLPNAAANVATVSASNRPGKMVSVPATDKTGAGEIATGVTSVVKKTQVKQTNGETAVSRATTVRVLNENQNPQPLTLSQGNSPYRRNPLGEIDTNVVGPDQQGSKKPQGEKTMFNKTDQTVSRTRSSRLSQELNINPETLLNPSPNPNPPSYASLLLKDIQNFHKNPSTCVSKACPGSIDQQHKPKVVNNDTMEPSLHKYVTVRRGGGDADTEEQESSGSNSFAGSQQLSWMSSSWEPSSGDSAECWTSKSRSSMEFEKSGEYPRNGIGRGRVGGQVRSAYSLPNNATIGSI